jgi:apolipoprotein N-acyltransferase
MRLPVLALVLGAAGFAAFGLALLAAPGLLALVDLAPKSATGRSDLRAVFGGLEAGFGAFLALAARRPAWHGPALVAQCLALGGVVVGRLASLALDGAPRPVTFALAGVEAVGALLAGAALWKHGAVPRAG